MSLRSILALLPILAAGCAGPRLARFEYARPAMGTTFRLVLYAPAPGVADAAAEAAFARIAALDASLSDYDETSELSRLSAASQGGPMAAPVEVSRALFEVLAHAEEIAERTDGAFDVTVGPFVRLWRRSARQGELPSGARLAEAAPAVGHRHVALDEGARTVRLRTGGMRLDLGGIAKGYALDEALAVLRGLGIERALVDGGGDIAVGAPPPGSAGWRIALEGAAPVTLLLARAAVATSGDAYRGVTIDGVRYSHLVDPRTGLGLTDPITATVVASTGMHADALASAICVLGSEAGLALIDREAGVEARVVTGQGRGRSATESAGFARIRVR